MSLSQPEGLGARFCCHAWVCWNALASKCRSQGGSHAAYVTYVACFSCVHACAYLYDPPKGPGAKQEGRGEATSDGESGERSRHSLRNAGQQDRGPKQNTISMWGDNNKEFKESLRVHCSFSAETDKSSTWTLKVSASLRRGLARELLQSTAGLEPLGRAAEGKRNGRCT